MPARRHRDGARGEDRVHSGSVVAAWRSFISAWWSRTDADARANLRVLEQRDDSAVVGPAGLVAELLEERGEYEAALVWFDRALGPDADRLAAEIPQRDTPSLSDIPLYGRQRCRVAIGRPADALDRAQTSGTG